MKILVTGANGYIGHKVICELLKHPVTVVAVDIKGDHVHPDAQFIQADIFEERPDWYTYLGSPDVCLHLAWREGFNHKSPRHMGDLSSHYRFLTAMMDGGLPQLAVMGTMHEVGYHEGAIDENTPCNPISLYGISKNALRQSVLAYAREKGTLCQWLRAFYIYGDDLFGSSIFCKLRQAAAEGKETFPFTTGKNKFDFIHERDLAAGIVATVLQREVSGIINICSGKPVSLAEQVEWYIRENNLPIRLDYGKFPDRPYDSPCIYGDDTKFRAIMDKVKV